MLATVLGAVLARTAALLGLLGRLLLATALGTTAAGGAFGCGWGSVYDGWGSAFGYFGVGGWGWGWGSAFGGWGCACGCAFVGGFGDYMPFRFTKFFFCFCYNFVVAYVFDCH